MRMMPLSLDQAALGLVFTSTRTERLPSWAKWLVITHDGGRPVCIQTTGAGEGIVARYGMVIPVTSETIGLTSVSADRTDAMLGITQHPVEVVAFDDGQAASLFAASLGDRPRADQMVQQVPADAIAGTGRGPVSRAIGTVRGDILNLGPGELWIADTTAKAAAGTALRLAVGQAFNDYDGAICYASDVAGPTSFVVNDHVKTFNARL